MSESYSDDLHHKISRGPAKDGGTFYNNCMNIPGTIEHITDWLKSYSEQSGTNGFVVGVSGGIDSAVTSTLCALTGRKLLVLEMPIYQAASQVSRAQEHIAWLKSKYPNVKDACVELTATFNAFMLAMPEAPEDEQTQNLSLANSRARLRMTALYYVAGLHKLLVAGTGNKVEDFGVGFYTKYGDGGVDLSPIADLYKTEVYALASEMGIVESILKAAPTDGLWGDDRTDEDQIGASYRELEWAMEFIRIWSEKNGNWNTVQIDQEQLTDRQRQVLQIYWRMNRANQHKMLPIPVCLIPAKLR
jgi:NAD+ synthase